MPKRKLGLEGRARLFKALMHPARLAILEVLRSGEACVCHMEAALGCRQAYLSQQLMVLRDARLVDDRRDGLNIYYHVSASGIFAVLDAARSALGEKAEKPVPSVIASCSCPHCVEKVAARSAGVTSAA